jgi:hypothetical protein
MVDEERDIVYEIEIKVRRDARKRKERSDEILESVYEVLVGEKCKTAIYVKEE